MARSLLGTRIRERRKAKGLSQTALAKKAGISVSYMNLIEHNRRGIAGRTLLTIAESLDVEAKDLSQDADSGMLLRLQEAAASEPHLTVEASRIEEFVGRFPGWARLSARLYDHMQLQSQSLMAISDRLGHDPFFSEAMHLILSNVTAIRSTSDILANSEDIPEDVAAKFLANLQTDSTHLSQTVSKLLAYYDAPDKDNQNTSHTQSKIDAFWELNHYFVPELEQESASEQKAVDKVMSAWNFSQSSEEPLAEKALKRYARIAQQISTDKINSLTEQFSYDLALISNSLECSLSDVFFRLAHMPAQPNKPEFGLIECDGSGGVLFRKQLKTFSLPRSSSACPLWPLYRALSQPGQPIQAIMETPTGDRFLTFSYAERSSPMTFDMPGTIKSAMLFTPDLHYFPSILQKRKMPELQVGLNCAVCPREQCQSRRMPSILNT